jgi:hypothetical protein
MPAEMRIGSPAPKRKLGPPTSDVLVQESLYDRGWVGAVVGQIENDHPTMMLPSPKVSTVNFDSAGDVIGGSRGTSTRGSLPGVRAYFSACWRADSVPIDSRRQCGGLGARPVRADPLGT